MQFNVLTLDPFQPWKSPPSLRQKLDLDIPGVIDDTFCSRSSRPRHKTRRDNLERLLDEENDEWDGESVMLKKRLRDQMQKDALEPLGGNDSARLTWWCNEGWRQIKARSGYRYGGGYRNNGGGAYGI